MPAHTPPCHHLIYIDHFQVKSDKLKKQQLLPMTCYNIKLLSGRKQGYTPSSRFEPRFAKSKSTLAISCKQILLKQKQQTSLRTKHINRGMCSFHRPAFVDRLQGQYSTNPTGNSLRGKRKGKVVFLATA